MKVFSYQSFNLPSGCTGAHIASLWFFWKWWFQWEGQFIISSESETPNPRQDQFPRQDSTKADLSAPILIRYYEWSQISAWRTDGPWGRDVAWVGIDIFRKFLKITEILRKRDLSVTFNVKYFDCDVSSVTPEKELVSEEPRLSYVISPGLASGLTSDKAVWWNISLSL